MQRRKYLVAIGSIAAGGAAAMGTGAFKTQEAERSARAKVQNDEKAQIQLISLDEDYARPVGTGTNNRTLSIKADLQNDDALTDYGPIFQIGNSNSVAGDKEDYEVYITVQSNLFTKNEDNKGDRIVQFDHPGGALNRPNNQKPGNPPVLSPGDTVDVSMTLDTRDLKNIAPSGSGSFKLFKQITIVANEV
jgi:hypothetical protein